MRNRGANACSSAGAVRRRFRRRDLLALSGCSSRAAQQPSTGIAYAGPANLNLRKDLRTQSAGGRNGAPRRSPGGDRHAPPLHQGAHVAGCEGWTDSNLVLTEQHMADPAPPSRERCQAAVAGSATVYDVLNMHTEPTPAIAQFFPNSGRRNGRGDRTPAHAAWRVAACSARGPSGAKVCAPKKKGKTGSR
jgi:hypothetical protein